MKIIFIGAGNVATHLSLALQQAGHEILQVYSRTEVSASELALKLNVPFTNDFKQISDKAELYIYAVSDSAIADLASKSLADDALHVHTAGSVSVDVFEGKKQRYGVLYPMQTFSKNMTVRIAEIPFFVEGSELLVVDTLKSLTLTISNQCFELNSEQRTKIHLSAVFCCNFVNYLYHVAYQLVNENGLPFEVMIPLIEETANKIKNFNPWDAQTGPAKRNDIAVMEKHLNLLNSRPQLQQLYNQLSQMIVNEYLHKS